MCIRDRDEYSNSELNSQETVLFRHFARLAMSGKTDPFWGDVALKVTARRVAVEIGRKLVIYKTKNGALLLPAVAGFAPEDRPDGPVVNLSYWVFPAFARLPLVAPEIDWRGIVQSGLDALKLARFGPDGLPAEWISFCLLYTSPSPRDRTRSRMPSSA